MKIRIERDVMADAVAWAARSLPSRPSVPILAGLLIEADADGVTLSSFDYETSAQVHVSAQVIEEGTVLVSGKLLAEIARNLPDRPIDFTSDVTKAELVCGSARFTLQTLPVEDYPDLPAMPEESGQIPSDLFAEAVSQVVIAAGRDELLPIFTGVKFEIDGDRVSMLATDRYRMALRELEWTPTNSEAEGSALVPARVLSEAARSMANGETISLSLSSADMGESIIGFTGSGAGTSRKLTTRLLSGEFPKVRHLMDITPSVTVRCRTDELLASVKRVALVAERNTPMRMTLDDTSVSLEAATGDQAQGSEAIEADIELVAGPDAAIDAVGFNPHFMQDALTALDAPYVNFSFTAPGRPCLVQGLEEIDGKTQDDYKHVIMLMKLPN